MQIHGLDGLTSAQIQSELERGGRFVVFQYCISIILMTFRRGSDVFFIRPGEGTLRHSARYSLLSFVVGWWGIPWGPIYTVGALVTNAKGGRDVTAEVLAALAAPEAPPPLPAAG